MSEEDQPVKPKRKWKNMDAERWKSIIVDRKTYDEICVIKDVEGRTLSGQVRLIFQDWKTRNLSIKDVAFVDSRVEEMRAQAKADKAS